MDKALPFLHSRYSATAKFFRHYLDLCEHLPDDLSKTMSKYREKDAESHALLNEIEELSKRSQQHEIDVLSEKIRQFEKSKLKQQKLMGKIDAMVIMNIDTLTDRKLGSDMEITHGNKTETNPELSVRRESRDDTPARDYPMDQLLKKQKKVKKALIFEHLTPEKLSTDSDSSDYSNVQDITMATPPKSSSTPCTLTTSFSSLTVDLMYEPLDEYIPPASGPDLSNLIMLADVACKRKEDEIAAAKKAELHANRSTFFGESSRMTLATSDRNSMASSSKKPTARERSPTANKASKKKLASRDSSSNFWELTSKKKPPKAVVKKARPVEQTDSDSEDESDEETVKCKKPRTKSRSSQDALDDQPTYCVCNKHSFGRMIACDNESCVGEWFHFACVGLKRSPKGKWYCPKCRSKKSNMLKKELRGDII